MNKADILERPTVDEPSLDGSLEEQWGQKLRCEARNHSSDPNGHAVDEPASVRGTAPCGRTMNICSKFAETFRSFGWASVRCQCGDKHFASSFRFTEI